MSTVVIAIAIAAITRVPPKDPARPGYHYTRPYGWQNDPVPYRDETGTYHLFPLCDPNATTQWQRPPVYDHSVSHTHVQCSDKAYFLICYCTFTNNAQISE